MAKLKILHSADIQVKVREKDLSKSYAEILLKIEEALISENIDIYILAGDLFEYANANDAERKIMYNHIGRVLSLTDLREFVVMAGNHDLEKDKKQIDSNRGSNAIDTFIAFIDALDENLSKKVTYLKKQQQYLSKATDDLGYIAYSLEDGPSNGSNLAGKVIDDSIYNISIYHDILKEYVDDTKLPVRKEHYNKLASIEDFKTPLIIAGDIHVNWSRHSADLTKKFIYPGSPIQRNYGEGAYYKIRKGTSNYINNADQKVLKIYDLDTDAKQYSVVDYPLPTVISYITFDFNTNYVVPEFKTILADMLRNVVWGTNETFIKLKLSNSYAKYELDIFKIVSEVTAKAPSLVCIETAYDKFVILSNDDKVIEEMSEETLNNITSSEFDFDSLTLDDAKLAKLFNTVLDQHIETIKKEVQDEALVQEILENIKSLFLEQLDISLKSAPSFAIVLEALQCNGFMNLGANDIKLDIPGLTRITGTNGVGKTTAYHMLRWIIDDEVMENMSKKTKTKNSLHVFNNKKHDLDIINCRLIAKVNGTKIAITRSVGRIWKLNTSDETKQSLNWKDYVSSINKTVKLEVFKEGTETKVLTGEEADGLIKKWFGNVTQTIMILNQQKILSMLNLPSADLKQMVLDYIGVDYLNKLEENLELVKASYNLQRPKVTKETLKVELLRLQDKKETEQNKVVELKQSHELTKSTIKPLVDALRKVNNDLVDLGNVENKLEKVKENITSLLLEKEAFQEQTKKPLPVFVEIAPIQVENDFHKLTVSQGTENQNRLKHEIAELEDTKNIKFGELQTELRTNIGKLKTATNDTCQNLAGTFKDLLDTSSGLIRDNFDRITEILQPKITVLQDKQTTLIADIQRITLEIHNITQRNIAINEELSSTTCKTCGKAFDDNKDAVEQRKNKLSDELKTNLERFSDLTQELRPITAENLEVTKAIETVKNALGNANIHYYDGFVKNDYYGSDAIKTICEDIEKIKKSNDFNEIAFQAGKNNNAQYFIDNKALFITDNANITFLEQLAEMMIAYIEHDQMASSKILAHFLNPVLVFKPVIAEIIILIEVADAKILANKIELEQVTQLVNGSTEKLREDKNKYITDLEAYNSALQRYNNAINEITLFNNNVEEHNKRLVIVNNTLITEESSLILLNIDLTKYLELRANYDLGSKQIFDLEAEVNRLANEIQNINLSLNTIDGDIKVVEKGIMDYIEYQRHTLIYGIYSKLIKKDFRDIVFEYYRNFLNNTLNILLQDLNFKLFWDVTGDLYMAQVKNGVASYTPVQLVSGMETCFQGLSLIYAIHMLNVKNNISNIFIDEISGQLNSGKELQNKDEIHNFQEQLIMLLSKFDKKSVFIIDHVIENLYETHTYEVVATTKGSKFISV